MTTPALPSFAVAISAYGTGGKGAAILSACAATSSYTCHSAFFVTLTSVTRPSWRSANCIVRLAALYSHSQVVALCTHGYADFSWIIFLTWLKYPLNRRSVEVRGRGRPS